MRAWCYGAGLGVVFGLATALWAQQQLTVDGARNLLGSSGGKPMQFKPLDTSKAVAPLPTFAQKKAFTLKSLVPSWLRPAETPAAPTSMRALKRPSSAGANTTTPAAFQPTPPGTPSP